MGEVKAWRPEVFRSMNPTTNIILENNSLLVSGELNFVTVSNLYNDSLPLLASRSTLAFDFSRVTFANSAGLALLVEWALFAKQAKKNITFSHLPAQLLAIIHVAGLDDFLSAYFIT